MKTFYADYAATTPVSPSVLHKMNKFQKGQSFGNPNSIHLYGTKAADAVVQARQTIADCLKVSPEEIIFTSGATEANNLAIKGIAFANKSKGQHIITTEVEHSSVYNTCKQLETHFGFKVTYLKPNRKGEISFTQLYDAIRPDTILISVMRANNETGKIYNIPCFTELAFIQDIPFHTDATQSFAFLHDYPKVMGVNAFSFTSHKINGPKGVGALYLKHDTPCLPIITGGHQEHGMRGGTTSVPLVVGFAEAVKAAYSDSERHWTTLNNFTQEFIKQLSTALTTRQISFHIYDKEPKLPNLINIEFPGIDAQSFVTLLSANGIHISAGSACDASSVEPSRVLLACGYTPEQALSSVRFSFGEENKINDIPKMIEIIVKTLEVYI